MTRYRGTPAPACMHPAAGARACMHPAAGAPACMHPAASTRSTAVQPAHPRQCIPGAGYHAVRMHNVVSTVSPA